MKTFITISFLALAGFSVAAPLAEPETSSAVKNQLFSRSLSCFDFNHCNTGNANTLANRLIGYGTQSCDVNANGQYWVKMGSENGCYVWGRSETSSPTSSYCRDVGYAVQNIINSCQSGGFVSGSNQAGGNGNFDVLLEAGNPNN